MNQTIVLPALWTVGPSDERNGTNSRLGRYQELSGNWRWACVYKKIRGNAYMRICAWPTRAAALAAGKAFGWSEPVARRVVRK